MNNPERDPSQEAAKTDRSLADYFSNLMVDEEDSCRNLYFAGHVLRGVRAAIVAAEALPPRMAHLTKTHSQDDLRAKLNDAISEVELKGSKALTASNEALKHHAEVSRDLADDLAPQDPSDSINNGHSPSS